MNDFSELESELKKLRPVQPSAELGSKIERAFADLQNERDNIIRPESRQSGRRIAVERSEFRISWIGLGLGLATAAAIFLILARPDFHPGNKPQPTTLGSTTPALQSRPPAPSPNYQPAGLTQVVYGRHDEGLVFPRGASEPARRVWTAKRETLRWRDRVTGSQLAVSYPAEEVTLTPVSGQ